MLITINGVMGTGKSTMARLLSDRFQIPMVDEIAESVFNHTNLFEGNCRKMDRAQFLSIQHWAMHGQIINLRRGVALAQEYGGAIVVSHPWAQFYCFVQTQFDLGLVPEEDYNAFHQVLSDSVLPEPDLNINLVAPMDIVWERIRSRSRQGEKADPSFIASAITNFSAYSYLEAERLMPQTRHLNLKTEDLTPEELSESAIASGELSPLNLLTEMVNYS